MILRTLEILVKRHFRYIDRIHFSIKVNTVKKNNAPLFQGFVLGKGAVKEQVYHILRDHILEGRLPPGTKMPSTRALSEMMSISRNSAIAGYDRLLDEGYILTRKGSGTYVSHHIPDRSISNS